MRFRQHTLTLSLILSFLLLCSVTEGQIDFSTGSGYKYLKGSAAASLPGDWMTDTYNDSGWSQGNAPFRYGDGTGGVLLGDMINNYSTL